jgi:hypothetical protein
MDEQKQLQDVEWRLHAEAVARAQATDGEAGMGEAQRFPG